MSNFNANNIQQSKEDIPPSSTIIGTTEGIFQETSELIGSITSREKHQTRAENTLDFVIRKMNSLIKLWNQHHDSKKYEEEQHINADRETFKNSYMEFMTSAFADELDDLRYGRMKDRGDSPKKKKKKNVNDEDIIQQQNLKLPSNVSSCQSLKENDLKLLAYCLESGMEIWTSEEKQLFLKKVRDDESLTSTDVAAKSLHEQSRKTLFGSEV